ncbi:MAG: histidine phosphatase family protein [Candidatus Omnitrophota bacterium]|jgi:broad specificity phosphatase PhoE
MTSTTLFLIRHGQTAWNFQKKYCGYKDIALNADGKKQAARLSERLKGQLIHKIYASDRKRAIQTAQIIFKDKEIEKIPDLREMHFGCFEGLKHKQIMKKYTTLYSRWLNDPFSVAIPRGEKVTDFRKRVVKAIKNIVAANTNKTIAVVCHGGTISIYITYLLKTRDFWKQIPRSTAISIIVYTDKTARIKIFNDTKHLEPPSLKRMRMKGKNG